MKMGGMDYLFTENMYVISTSKVKKRVHKALIGPSIIVTCTSYVKIKLIVTPCYIHCLGYSLVKLNSD